MRRRKEHVVMVFEAVETVSRDAAKHKRKIGEALEAKLQRGERQGCGMSPAIAAAADSSLGLRPHRGEQNQPSAAASMLPGTRAPWIRHARR